MTIPAMSGPLRRGGRSPRAGREAPPRPRRWPPSSPPRPPSGPPGPSSSPGPPAPPAVAAAPATSAPVRSVVRPSSAVPTPCHVPRRRTGAVPSSARPRSPRSGWSSAPRPAPGAGTGPLWSVPPRRACTSGSTSPAAGAVPTLGRGPGLPGPSARSSDGRSALPGAAAACRSRAARAARRESGACALPWPVPSVGVPPRSARSASLPVAMIAFQSRSSANGPRSLGRELHAAPGRGGDVGRAAGQGRLGPRRGAG